MSSIYSSLVFKLSHKTKLTKFWTSPQWDDEMVRMKKQPLHPLLAHSLSFSQQTQKTFSFLSKDPASKRRHGNALHPIKIFGPGGKLFFRGKRRLGPSSSFSFLVCVLGPPFPAFRASGASVKPSLSGDDNAVG